MAFDFDDLDDESTGVAVANFDKNGIPRGQCQLCDCLEWCSPTESLPGRSVPTRKRAHNVCVPTTETLADMLSEAHTAKFVKVQLGMSPCAPKSPGAMDHKPEQCCRRCGCPTEGHMDLTMMLREMTASGMLVEAEAGWDDLERALFFQSLGSFRPGHDDRPEALERRSRSTGLRGEGGKALVSVICPTAGANRRKFHPFLYTKFCEQDYPVKELIVVDSGHGIGASEFFTQGPPAQDSRVVYRYLDLPMRDLSIGAKRNLACRLSAGCIITHFDDDDIYTPGYISRMVEAMQVGAAAGPHVHVQGGAGGEPGGPAELGQRGLAAAAVTLASWHTFDLADGSFSKCDIDFEVSDPKLHHHWTFGWGFSHAYLWDAWRHQWFRDLSQGEDGYFMDGLLARGWRVAVVRDDEGHCAHTHHGRNTSMKELVRPVPAAELAGSCLADFGQLLMETVAQYTQQQ